MRVIITAGGTGGHIYPALSIIDKIKEKDKSASILYIGTTDRMEKDIVPNKGIDYFGIKIRGIDRKFSLKNFKTMYYFIKSVKQVKKKIREFKPDIVIGVGGYVTGPVIYAAHKLHIKTIIHEQNSVLGMTNKFLSKCADVVCVSLPNTPVIAKKVVYTGNPSSTPNINCDKKELGLKDYKKLVVIVMGSLGSKVVNEKLKSILPKLSNKDYEVLLVTGNNYYDEFKDIKVGNNIIIKPFVDNLKKIFSKTDLLVSRAGATTISEIISYKVPSILIPSPYVTDNHQYKNALSLVNKDASILIEEKNMELELVDKIDELLNDKEKLSKMRSNLSMMDIGDSAEKIYEVIEELL